MPDSSRTAEFVQHFSRSAQRLYAYVLTMTGHDPAADDVFQEVCKLAWEKFDQFQPGTDFLAWTCRIAFFCVMNHRRKKSKAPLPFSDAFFNAIDAELVEMASTSDARMRALADCYGKLSQRDRDLIDRRYAPDATTRQVAEQIGRPLSTVYRMLDRVHTALMRCVERTLSEGIA